MSHSSSDDSPEVECLSSHWSIVFGVAFVTNDDIKKAYIYKSVAWGGTAHCGGGSEQSGHSCNALTVAQGVLQQTCGWRKCSNHCNTVALTWTSSVLNLLQK